MEDVARRARVGGGHGLPPLPHQGGADGRARWPRSSGTCARTPGTRSSIEPDPWEAFAGTLRRNAEDRWRRRGACSDAILRSRSEAVWQHAEEPRAELLAATEELIARGRAAGVLRDDLTIDGHRRSLMCGVCSTMRQREPGRPDATGAATSSWSWTATRAAEASGHRRCIVHTMAAWPTSSPSTWSTATTTPRSTSGAGASAAARGRARPGWPRGLRRVRATSPGDVVGRAARAHLRHRHALPAGRRRQRVEGRRRWTPLAAALGALPPGHRAGADRARQAARPPWSRPSRRRAARCAARGAEALGAAEVGRGPGGEAGLRLDSEAARMLVALAGSGQQRLAREIEKLAIAVHPETARGRRGRRALAAGDGAPRSTTWPTPWPPGTSSWRCRSRRSWPAATSARVASSTRSSTGCARCTGWSRCSTRGWRRRTWPSEMRCRRGRPRRRWR